MYSFFEPANHFCGYFVNNSCQNFADVPQTAGLIIQPLSTVSGDIFWSVGPNRSV